MIQFGVFKTEQENDGLGGIRETEKLIYADYGYLDMLTGSNQNINQNSLVNQSTHILIMPKIPPDYKSLIQSGYIINIDNQRYRIEYVDNPVSLNHHLELYLKGEQDGV